MTKITSFDLTPFYRNTVGLDSLFDRIVNQIDHAAQTTNYPPYNIIKTSDESYQIQLAVAGFGQGDIDVSLHKGQLTIAGNKNAADEDLNYLHHGISARKFIRTFQLADYIEVSSAAVKDGILTVNLERNVPEEAKPKTIAITYTA